MIREYQTIPTTRDVGHAILRDHRDDLHVFGSYTAPDGDWFRDDYEHARIFTSWGFEDADFPILEVETTWNIDRSEPHSRKNETTEYRLCVGRKEEA